MPMSLFLLIRISTFICEKWVPENPSTIFLANSFTWKMPENSDYMYLSIFMLKTYNIILSEKDQIYKKLWVLLQFSVGS